MLAISNPEPKTSFSRAPLKPKDERLALLNFHLHIAGNCLNECGDDLVATEGWGDRSQNCLHDVRVIGDT